MDFPFGETLSVRSVTTTDDGLGNETTTEAVTSWGPCAVWDRTTQEFSGESADPHSPGVVVGLCIAGPRRSFDSDDVIVRNGVAWQVDGLPQENTVNPFTGWDPGIVVNVKRAGAV
jgi:hypothetical protein